MRPRRTTGVPVLPGCPARFSVINLILGFWVWQPAATQGTDSFAALTPVSWHDPDWQTVISITRTPKIAILEMVRLGGFLVGLVGRCG